MSLVCIVFGQNEAAGVRPVYMTQLTVYFYHFAACFVVVVLVVWFIFVPMYYSTVVTTTLHVGWRRGAMLARYALAAGSPSLVARGLVRPAFVRHGVLPPSLSGKISFCGASLVSYGKRVTLSDGGVSKSDAYGAWDEGALSCKDVWAKENGGLMSASDVCLMRSTSNSPYFNLALEECLLNDPNTPIAGCRTLFLWANEPSVIFGRFQNPHRELRLAACHEKGVHVVRRSTGGGTVYQDLGNFIFSFFIPHQQGVDEGIEAVRTNNLDMVCRALRSWNVDAEPAGRNDIHVNLPDGPRKISGSAFGNSKQLFLHHGTVLMNVEMTAMKDILNPHKAKLEAKGLQSVASRVLNVGTLNEGIGQASLSYALSDIFEQAFKGHVCKRTWFMLACQRWWCPW